MEDKNHESGCSTILDVLNSDCWRLILDKLHITNIIQSERVSRQWQQMIFEYLQGARFSIEYSNYKPIKPDNLRCLLMSEEDPESLDRIIRKWGPFIKKMDCVNAVIREDGLKDLGEHCLNLEDLTFYGLQDDVLLNKQLGHFKKLKRLHFNKCKYVTDECVSMWLTDTIEELAIEETKLVTGLCLTTLQSANLKTLSLKKCKALESRHLLAVVDRLTGLKKLELYFLPKEIFQNAHYLLNKTAKVEDLCLGWYERIELGSELIESVARLGRLRRLDLSFNMNANDEWLEVIARSCRLEELLVERCLDVSGRGVLAVCRAAGPALRALHVGSSRVIDDQDVVAFITACPNLTSVDLSYNWQATESLVGLAAAAARPRHLRLQVESTMVEGNDADLYPWLELDFGTPDIEEYDSDSQKICLSRTREAKLKEDIEVKIPSCGLLPATLPVDPSVRRLALCNFDF